MIIIIENEWLTATKITSLIFEDVAARTLKQRRFKNSASSILLFAESLFSCYFLNSSFSINIIIIQLLLLSLCHLFYFFYIMIIKYRIITIYKHFLF